MKKTILKLLYWSRNSIQNLVSRLEDPPPPPPPTLIQQAVRRFINTFTKSINDPDKGDMSWLKDDPKTWGDTWVFMRDWANKTFLKQSRCRHLKGGRVRHAVKDYAINLHTFVDFSQRVKCLLCGKEWWKEKEGQFPEEVLMMLDNTTNYPTSSEAVGYQISRGGRHVTFESGSLDDVRKRHPDAILSENLINEADGQAIFIDKDSPYNQEVK